MRRLSAFAVPVVFGPLLLAGGCAPSAFGSTNPVDAGCNAQWGEHGQTSPHVVDFAGRRCMSPWWLSLSTARTCQQVLNATWGVRAEHAGYCGVELAR